MRNIKLSETGKKVLDRFSDNIAAITFKPLISCDGFMLGLHVQVTNEPGARLYPVGDYMTVLTVGTLFEPMTEEQRLKVNAVLSKFCAHRIKGVALSSSFIEQFIICLSRFVYCDIYKVSDTASLEELERFDNIN